MLHLAGLWHFTFLCLSFPTSEMELNDADSLWEGLLRRAGGKS